MLDLLTVWDHDNEWSEMKQLGLTILLEFAAQDDIGVSRKDKKFQKSELTMEVGGWVQVSI